MLKNIKSIAISVCICVVISVLLAVTNSITAPIIEKNQNLAANEALLEVMPDGTGFEQVDISSLTLPATVTEAYKEVGGAGYVIKLKTSGYGSDMVIMCGISADGVVTGATCLSSNETLGKEKTYGAEFADKNAEAVEGVEVIAGATKTTEAYKNAVKDALNAAIILGGGSVDIRTEEEILADNLAAALPAGDKFTKLFITEDIGDIDAVYTADNGAGYVFVAGEQFVGVADGKVVTDGVADGALFIDAASKLAASENNGVDIANCPDYILSVKQTLTGNFIIETKGAGYGIKGGDEWHPASGEYIVVRVALTPEGKILDCITVSQAETKGLGDACASESFYGQFKGKTEADYTEIDAIGGATMTTDGYKQAIQRAYEALGLAKGGNR